MKLVPPEKLFKMMRAEDEFHRRMVRGNRPQHNNGKRSQHNNGNRPQNKDGNRSQH